MQHFSKVEYIHLFFGLGLGPKASKSYQILWETMLKMMETTGKDGKKQATCR